MRSIKELLQAMLGNKHLFNGTLCHWAYELFLKDIITVGEFRSLDEYIKGNRPDYFSWTNFIENYSGVSYGRPSLYFFPYGKIKPRIYWIKKHIKKLS